jgi:phosphatidylinositol-3-phosphatase
LGQAYDRRVARKLAVWALLLTGLAGAAACPAQARLDGVPAFGHVFLIVGENTAFKQVTPRNAPYLTGTVIPHGAWLTNYRGLTDGSLGDYAAMVSGQFVRCERDNDFSFTNGDVPGQHACHQSVNNLFHQLDARGISWQEWTESAANACDMFDHGSTWSRNAFVSHHSPALYFDDIQAHHSSEDVIPSPECRQKVLAAGTTGPNDMSAFDSALATGTVGRFDMVIPNDCENGHDECGTHNAVRQFDDFLAREVPKIQGSPAFGPDGLIVVVWDEGSDLDPLHVGAALLGPLVKPTTSGARLDHYSLLRTLEDGFGIGRHLAHAARAHAFAGIWR